MLLPIQNALGPLGHRPLGLPFGDGSTLADGLAEYYNLDEASGARASEFGLIGSLADINTVGSAAGKNGLAANFIGGNSEVLQSEAPTPQWWTTALGTCISMWLYKEAGSNGFLMSVANCFTFQWDGSGSMRTMLRISGNNTYHNYAAINLGAWNHLLINHNRAGLAFEQWFNGVKVGSFVGPFYGGPMDTGGLSNPFTVGGYASTSNRDCIIDEVGFWNRPCTDDEIVELAAGAYYGVDF